MILGRKYVLFIYLGFLEADRLLASVDSILVLVTGMPRLMDF